MISSAGLDTMKPVQARTPRESIAHRITYLELMQERLRAMIESPHTLACAIPDYERRVAELEVRRVRLTREFKAAHRTL